MLVGDKATVGDHLSETQDATFPWSHIVRFDLALGDPQYIWIEAEKGYHGALACAKGRLLQRWMKATTSQVYDIAQERITDAFEGAGARRVVVVPTNPTTVGRAVQERIDWLKTHGMLDAQGKKIKPDSETSDDVSGVR